MLWLFSLCITSHVAFQVVDRAGEAHQVAGWEAPDGALYFDLVPQVMSLWTKYSFFLRILKYNR